MSGDDKSSGLYFYAEKYQVDDLKTTLIKHFFSGTTLPFNSGDLEDGLHLGSKYDIPGIINSLDKVGTEPVDEQCGGILENRFRAQNGGFDEAGSAIPRQGTS